MHAYVQINEISDPWILIHAFYSQKILLKMGGESKRIGYVDLGKVFECSRGTYHISYYLKGCHLER